jgi:hypothetical protein
MADHVEHKSALLLRAVVLALGLLLGLAVTHLAGG